MSNAEIVAEIDAYLLCLRQARDLLQGSNRVATRTVAGPKQAVAQVAGRTSASRATSRNLKVLRQRNSAPRKPRVGNKPIDLFTAPSTLASLASSAISGTPLQSETSEQKVAQLPAVENRAQYSLRLHPKRRKSAAIKETPMPASPLKSIAPFRVVVVSAEEVQKARRQAESAAVEHHRAPTTLRTGRLAFEALFKDEADSAVSAAV
jgi:hypothetical protein